jgi:hypothetical protein
LVYGKEAIVPTNFYTKFVHHQATKMLEEESIQSQLTELIELEEDHFLVQYHQWSRSHEKGMA